MEAVYRREVEQLVDAVPHLLEKSPAGEALHQWMHLFVNYIATKRLIAPSLGAAVGRTSPPHATPDELITRAISTLLKVAVRNGDVRKDIDPSDLLRALVGVMVVVISHNRSPHSNLLVMEAATATHEAPRRARNPDRR